jgi:hypothetical protein
MASSAVRRPGGTPNVSLDADIALLLERVCARLPHDYTRQLLRDVVRLKLELGFDGHVRDYLQRRSGEYPAVPGPGAHVKRGDG